MADKKSPKKGKDADLETGVPDPEVSEQATDELSEPVKTVQDPEAGDDPEAVDAISDLKDETPEPEPEPEPEIRRAETSRGGFGAAFIGGIVAACLGFLAAKSDFLDPVLPSFLKTEDVSGDIATLDTKISTQSKALAALDEKLAAISIPDQAPLEAQLAELGAQIMPLNDGLAALRTDLSGLNARLTDVEKRPISEGVSQAAIDAYERELTALQAAMATQRSEVEDLIANARAIKAQAQALETDASAAAAQAANRAIMAQLRSALDAGAPFAAKLDELAANGVDVPTDLSAVAQDGVQTLTALSVAFPRAAREALSVARAETAGADRGIGSFLQRQLGARSVTPRDGDDPDAVLSRAEAAVNDGRLADALDEIATLSDSAQSAMGDWVSQAQTRLAAETAADALAESLNTN